jgi:bifunctional DNase/RNase
MKNIPLEIVGFFQPYPSDQSCFIVFKEESGKKLIVRIGISDIDAIIFSLENIKYTIPFIHDLFFNLAQMADVRIKEIVIDKFENEKFYSHIIFILSKHELQIPARICDAIALAVRFKSPILISKEILDKTSIHNMSTKNYLKNLKKKEKPSIPDMISKLSYEELKAALEKAIQNENYEMAGKIRDELLKRNQPKGE